MNYLENAFEKLDDVNKNKSITEFTKLNGANRKEGFYWVVFDGHLTIGYYLQKEDVWILHDGYGKITENQLDEIYENRIQEPNEIPQPEQNQISSCPFCGSSNLFFVKLIHYKCRSCNKTFTQ